jgi:hypothetical protein
MNLTPAIKILKTDHLGTDGHLEGKRADDIRIRAFSSGPGQGAN